MALTLYGNIQGLSGTFVVPIYDKGPFLTLRHTELHRKFQNRCCCCCCFLFLFFVVVVVVFGFFGGFFGFFFFLVFFLFFFSNLYCAWLLNES